MTALAAAFAAIDAANAADPVRVVWNGADHARARLHGERASYWLRRLGAVGGRASSDAVELAVRAHHLRRWALPRASYPEGRAGYHRWKKAQRDGLAASFDDVLAPLGIDAAVIARAAQLAQRVGLGSDAETQLVEDAACLVFCEVDLGDVLSQLGEDKTAEAIRRTLPKMSQTAIGLAPEATPAGAAFDLLVAVATGTR